MGYTRTSQAISPTKLGYGAQRATCKHCGVSYVKQVHPNHLPWNSQLQTTAEGMNPFPLTVIISMRHGQQQHL